MKKTYFAPEMEDVKIDMKYTILAGSVPGSKDGDDPETKETDPDYNLFD